MAPQQARAVEVMLKLGASSAFASAAARAMLALPNTASDAVAGEVDHGLHSWTMLSHAGESFKICKSKEDGGVVEQGRIAILEAWHRSVVPDLQTVDRVSNLPKDLDSPPFWARLAMHVRGEVVGHHHPKLAAPLMGPLGGERIRLVSVGSDGTRLQTSLPFVVQSITQHVFKYAEDRGVSDDGLLDAMNRCTAFSLDCAHLVLGIALANQLRLSAVDE
ncbi:MAG: hypothetical protein AAGI53_14600 [Planctomycetota bacterium]